MGMAELGKVNDLLSSLLHRDGSSSSNVRCEILPGRGRVLIAAREIRCGDEIFVDQAITCAGTLAPGSAAARLFAQVNRLCGSRGKEEREEEEEEEQEEEVAEEGSVEWDVGTMWCALHTLLECEAPSGWPLPTLTPELQDKALLLYSSGRRPTVLTQQVQAALRLSMMPAKLERLVD